VVVRRLVSLCAVVAATGLASHAYGDASNGPNATNAPSSPGATPLRQARSACDRGSLENAEPLYREALEKGGLAPGEVLEGYVRLGSIRAALGKKDSALAAFRAASILDDKFAVPSEAGSKGVALAERAKKETARIGSIQLGIQVPKNITSGKSFKVTATLDKGHLPIVTKIALAAKDGTSAKEVTLDSKPDESVDFEIGSDITLPGASILVHVDALDGHQNRLASAEERVKIPDKDGNANGAVGVGAAAVGGAAANALKPPTNDTSQQSKKNRSFWASPWPYIIGGIAVVGVGTAVYFGTRPPAQVQLGSAGVSDQ
jgi:hypothetical protein